MERRRCDKLDLAFLLLLLACAAVLVASDVALPSTAPRLALDVTLVYVGFLIGQFVQRLVPDD